MELGVELSSVFKSCKAFNINTLKEEIIEKKDCEFNYRSSVFKTHQKRKYIIISVCFQLQKFPHLIKIDYGLIKAQFEQNYLPDIREVAKAVIAIRESKLPNPKKIGNCGSFFKNPLISIAHYELLKLTYPELPSYPNNNKHVKVPAAWLIDQLGFKGIRNGDAGVHKNQALVLVNHGKAEGKEILNLAKKIQLKVKETFNISLETEVNII